MCMCSRFACAVPWPALTYSGVLELSGRGRADLTLGATILRSIVTAWARYRNHMYSTSCPITHAHEVWLWACTCLGLFSPYAL